MFKKTLIAAALVAATSSAVAGTISVSGTAYKVGNEYLASYTGSALEGDLNAAAIGITYKAGIALGVDNTLKFVFTGGAIEADTGLKLQAASSTRDFPAAQEATLKTAMDTAVDAVVAVAPANTATDTAAQKAAAIAVLQANAYTSSTNQVMIDAINAVVFNTNLATTATDIKAAYNALDMKGGLANTADLVDFGVDANGNYEWVLFKLTTATLVSDVLAFNDTETTPDFATNATTMFTKATIGAGDLKIAMPEAKDGTGANLAAPVAAAKTLVTTATQFSVTATAVTDTIDVEQDRLYFVDNAAAQDTTGTFTFDVTENAVDLGITAATAAIAFEVSGSLTGVDSVDLVDSAAIAADDSAAFDTDNLVAGTGIEDATITATVDGTTNLATRSLGLTVMVTPAEADTEAFYLLGAANTASKAFIWDLNGSEITFPYAPIGYSHITTNFELANSGDQEGDILLTAFGRDGATYSGTLTQKAKASSLVKVSETDVATALGLTAGASISLTISTTAPDADIKASGYSNLNSGGRMALLSDAYEGEKASCTGTIAGGNGTITCN